MIAWIFWRTVETLIIYGVCSIFTDKPDTLGLTITIESILIIIYIGKYFICRED